MRPKKKLMIRANNQGGLIIKDQSSSNQKDEAEQVAKT